MVSPEYTIGKHNTEMLMDRFENHYFLKNMVLVGSGVDQQVLEEAAEAGTAKVEVIHGKYPYIHFILTKKLLNSVEGF